MDSPFRLPTVGDCDALPWSLVDHPAFAYYRRLDAVRDAVLADLQREWDLESAAAVAGLSAKYFWTLFFDRVEIRFREWLHLGRIRQALRLLRQTNFSTTEVADAVGYRSRRTFGRSFRPLVGVPPASIPQQVMSSLRMRFPDNVALHDGLRGSAQPEGEIARMGSPPPTRPPGRELWPTITNNDAESRIASPVHARSYRHSLIGVFRRIDAS